MTRWVVLTALLVGLLASLALHGLLGSAAAGRPLGAPVLVTSNGFNAAASYSPQARDTGSFVDAVFARAPTRVGTTPASVFWVALLDSPT